jgi:rhodanese-related sulfurtransferase
MTVRRVSPAEAHALMQSEGYVYLDVREAGELVAGFPEGARHVPLDAEFVARVSDRYAHDAKLVIGCASGIRSLRAATQLIEAGFTNVVDQRAGFSGVRDVFGRTMEKGWSASGLPVSYDVEAAFDHGAESQRKKAT